MERKILETEVRLFSEAWRSLSSEPVQMRGTVYLQNQSISSQSLQAIGVRPIDELITVLGQANGFFSVIAEQGSGFLAIVDKVRSFPLFYAVADSKLFLSDHADWVREKANDTEMSSASKGEFLIAGYVLGRDTLFDNVKQLQAGEYLSVIDGHLKVVRYFVFEHTAPAAFDKIQKLAELDEVAKDSIDRLIDYAAGRQIVIPLSGGYDSRLIATLLKEREYENVLCFSYGRPGNRESEYSRRVASELGLKWHFVEYSEESWHSVWGTKEHTDCQLYASNWASLPHEQDWLAIKILKDTKTVDSNAVFVPGHCCVTGFIPADLADVQRDFDYVENQIRQKHINLCSLDLIDEGARTRIADKLKQFIGDGLFTHDYCASRIMTFNWQERQAKYIGNSVRDYECFGFDWWMPLWDTALIKFWASVPLELRYDRKLYVEYVNGKYKKNSDEARRDPLISNASHDSLLSRIKRSIVFKSKTVEKLARALYAGFRKVVPRRHIHAIEGRFDPKVIRWLHKAGFQENGYRTYFFLQKFANVDDLQMK